MGMTQVKKNEQDFEQKSLYFIRTERKGIPVIWENVKNYETLRRIVRVFDTEGETKIPLFTKEATDSSLTMVVEGDYIVKIFFDDNGTGISILNVATIDKYSNKATVDVVKRYANDQGWINNANIIENESAVKKIIKNIQQYIVDIHV